MGQIPANSQPTVLLCDIFPTPAAKLGLINHDTMKHVSFNALFTATRQQFLKMVIEWLKVRVSPELREKFIQKDAEIWTSMLATYPGFLGKEVWINPEIPTEVVIVIRWENREAWESVPPEQLKQVESLFSQEFGEQQLLIEAAEYQVRKFPLASS